MIDRTTQELKAILIESQWNLNSRLIHRILQTPEDINRITVEFK